VDNRAAGRLAEGLGGQRPEDRETFGGGGDGPRRRDGFEPGKRRTAAGGNGRATYERVTPSAEVGAAGGSIASPTA